MLTEVQKNRANAAARALLNAGVPADKLSWLIAQLSLETTNFTSKVSLLDNNLSGIKFYGQKNTTKGQPAPINEDSYYSADGDLKRDFYAHYNDLNEWAKDYLRIINKETYPGAKIPLQASTPEDFVKRLKDNHYFSGDLATYINIVTTNAKYYTKNVLNSLQDFIKNNPGKTSLTSVLIISAGLLYLATKN